MCTTDVRRYCAHRCAQPQLANNTSGCRTSAIWGIMYESCTTKSPVLSFQLHRLLRVLKLYYEVASSQLPAHGLLHVLQLYYQVASSHLPTPQLLRVLKLYYQVASSHLPAPQLVRVLKLYYKVASSQLPAPQIAPRTKVVLETRQFSASSSTDCSAY